MGALGAIAKTESLPARFDAVVWVLLPINELATRQQIASRLTTLGQGFRFQDEAVRGGGAMALPGRSLTIASQSTSSAPVDIEQGVAMDGNELGDLGAILND